MHTARTQFFINATGNWLVKHRSGVMFYTTPDGTYLPTGPEKRGLEISDSIWEKMLGDQNQEIRIPTEEQAQIIGHAIQKRNNFFQKISKGQVTEESTAFSFGALPGFDKIREKFSQT